MNEVVPGRAGQRVKENEDIWKAYQNLGQACYEAGPLTAQALGDGRYETLYHGGTMVSAMFFFKVLE